MWKTVLSKFSKGFMGLYLGMGGRSYGKNLGLLGGYGKTPSASEETSTSSAFPVKGVVWED